MSRGKWRITGGNTRRKKGADSLKGDSKCMRVKITYEGWKDCVFFQKTT